MSTRITRRAFVQVAGVAVLAACGDDPQARRDTADTAASDTGSSDTVETEPDTSGETEIAPLEDTELETVAEVAPDVAADTGPEPIGTFDPDDRTEAQAQFTYGVQAGDPTPSGIVLWTRYSGSEALEVVVFAAGGFAQPGDLYVRESVSPASGFVHVEIDGLAPDTIYRYAFVTPSQRSRVGQFRTALAPDALRVVTFGGVSCVNQGYRPYRTLTRASEANLDFFIQAGDAAYMDGALSLADYRELWRQAFDTDGYRGLFASTGMYSTWDDHEVYDNWNPEIIDPAILGYAQQTYLEHSALRLADPGVRGPWKIWRSYRWGQTLEVFVLDCRSERRPSTRFSDAPIYLSRAQMNWLKQGLRDSPCTFKLIVNSVPITDMPANFPQDNDRWQGYAKQRDEILGHIEGPPAIGGVLWLSGDFHFGSVTNIDPAGGKYDGQHEVLMGQGANMPNPVWPALDGHPQFPFVTGTDNYVRFVCDPAASPPTITASFIDGDGTSIYEHTFEFPS